MILQLDPMVPVYVPEFDIEGYAFLVTDYSQEHYKVFTVALDNGEIWDLDNRRVRFCINHSASRPNVNKKMISEFVEHLKPKRET